MTTGQNDFKQFDANKSNILTDLQYSDSTIRQNGNVAGMAVSNVMNKALYQVSTMVTALAQLAANRGQDVSDISLNSLVSVLDVAFPTNQPGYVPYSVNSGLTSINKVSDTEVSFTLASSGCVITFPSGKTYTLTAINNVTGILADGTYDFIIEESDISNGTVTPKAVLSSTVNETIANGTGGNDGDYNVNINVRPLYPEKKISGTWTEKQFLKLGGFVKSTTLGTPYIYTFNGMYIGTWFNVSCPNIYSVLTNIGTVSELQKPILYYRKSSSYTSSMIVSSYWGVDNANWDSGSSYAVCDKNTVKITTANGTVVDYIVGVGSSFLGASLERNPNSGQFLLTVERGF